jgi:hypothetical protein
VVELVSGCAQDVKNIAAPSKTTGMSMMGFFIEDYRFQQRFVTSPDRRCIKAKKSRADRSDQAFPKSFCLVHADLGAAALDLAPFPLRFENPSFERCRPRRFLPANFFPLGDFIRPTFRQDLFHGIDQTLPREFPILRL